VQPPYFSKSSLPTSLIFARNLLALMNFVQRLRRHPLEHLLLNLLPFLLLPLLLLLRLLLLSFLHPVILLLALLPSLLLHLRRLPNVSSFLW
jgi:hypothetical protein